MTEKEIKKQIRNEQKRIERNRRLIEETQIDISCCEKAIEFWMKELERKNP